MANLKYSIDEKGVMKPYAVVIGLDGMNGIQTARILADHNVPVIAIAKDPDHFCCRTNVCEEIIYTDTSSKALIHSLINLGRKIDEKAVLFPCTDIVVSLISKHRSDLEMMYHVLLPQNDVVEMMMDKIQFYTFAQENMFPIPRTIILNSRCDAINASRKLEYPCVIKPPMSSIPAWEHYSKLKAYKVNDSNELLAVYDRVSNLTDCLIIQEWIEGPEKNLFSCNCYFDANSKPLVTFVARKLRQWPPRTGESSLGVECRNDIVLKETIHLFESVQYQGLGYVEMKRDDRTGQHFILEPNIGRPTGRSAIAEAGGVDLIYTMYSDALGWPLPQRRIQKYTKVKWIYLRRDFQSALYYWRRKELSLQDWFLSWRGKKVFAIFSWRDPHPFIGDLIRSVRLVMSQEERRKRDYDNL